MIPAGRVMLVVAFALAAAWGGVALVAEEPKGKFEVHDLSLWILEPGSQQANLRTAYPSGLPATVSSSRTAPSDATARRVGPVNLITFYRAPTANLDVDLRTKAGTFLAHWPAGESLPNRLRWSGMPGLDLVEAIEDASELAFVDSEHWIRKAREGQALFVRRGARAERFLAYDVELNLPPPIRLEGGPDKFKVINTSGATLHDVLISRGTPAGRRVAWLDVLPASKPAAPAEPAKPAKPATAAADVFGDGKAPATAAPAVDKPADPAAAEKAQAAAAEKEKLKAENRAAAKRFLERNLKPKRAAAPTAAPAAAPAAAPTTPPATGVEVTLSDPLPEGAEETAAKTTGTLTERMSRAGLNAHEIELFLENYRSLFFEGDAVVVACRLDAGAIDEKIPLSVFPEPAKIVRVAMVLMRNADPQLGNEVDRLVAQLGEPKFSAREAAQKRLMELGPLAFSALNKALNNSDLEIVIRAERILLFQNQTPNPQAQPKPGAPAAPAAAAGAVFRKAN